MRKHLALLLIFASQAGFATTFKPVSVKIQIKESQGIIEGVVERIEFLDGEDGRIETKVVIFTNKWIGVTPQEESYTEVFYPGGRIGDKEYKVEGAPKLNVGENVVLFTRTHNKKNYIQNLGLGKFSIKKYGNKKIMVNQIFPSYPNVGQMGLKQFYGLAEWVKKEKFKERFKDKFEVEQERKAVMSKRKKLATRSIASVIPEESNKKSIVWLILVLGLLGIVSQFLRKKE